MQLSLLDTNYDTLSPPSTRYQGSKLKLLNWLRKHLGNLDFSTALDAFGGTGSVSFLMKQMGKSVTYNDYLRFNSLMAQGIIANKDTYLTDDDINFICSKNNIQYKDFIFNTFQDIYFTKDENIWLDMVAQNIPLLEDKNKIGLAYYALFQACLVKRPYNLFHRQNLYVRLADVPRSFGNKATWEGAFPKYFANFAKEANKAIFSNGTICESICYDALEVPGEYDLVYIDTPYINSKGIGVDYRDFYHFLEGLVNYEEWPDLIDTSRKHLPMKRKYSPWSDHKTIKNAFRDLFIKYKQSLLVISYRSDGIPSENEIVSILISIGKQVDIIRYGSYKYALSKNNSSDELLIIAR